MLHVKGTYYKGQIQLEKNVSTDKPVQVIVTFPKISETKGTSLKFSDFSFAQSRSILKNKRWSFSKTVIDDRSQDL